MHQKEEEPPPCTFLLGIKTKGHLPFPFRSPCSMKQLQRERVEDEVLAIMLGSRSSSSSSLGTMTLRLQDGGKKRTFLVCTEEGGRRRLPYHFFSCHLLRPSSRPFIEKPVANRDFEPAPKWREVEHGIPLSSSSSFVNLLSRIAIYGFHFFSPFVMILRSQVLLFFSSSQTTPRGCNH